MATNEPPVVSIAHLRGTVDATGETVTIQAPRRRKRRAGWRDHVAMADLGNLTKLELSGLEYRVLFAVMRAVPEKGGRTAFVTMEEIAEQIGSTTPSVSRAIKSLRERNIVWRPDSRIGRLNVSAWLMYNGDFDSWNMEAEKDPEPLWTRGVNTKTGEVA